MKATVENIKNNFTRCEVCRTKRGIEVHDLRNLGDHVRLVFPKGKEVEDSIRKNNFSLDCYNSELGKLLRLQECRYEMLAHFGVFNGSSGSGKKFYLEPLPYDDARVNAIALSVANLSNSEVESFGIPKNAIGSWQVKISGATTLVLLLPIPSDQRLKIANLAWQHAVSWR